MGRRRFGCFELEEKMLDGRPELQHPRIHPRRTSRDFLDSPLDLTPCLTQEWEAEHGSRTMNGMTYQLDFVEHDAASCIRVGEYFTQTHHVTPCAPKKALCQRCEPILGTNRPAIVRFARAGRLVHSVPQ